MVSTRQRFRAMLEGEDCTVAAPIFDPLSARIAELTGWQVCKMSGSVAKAANNLLPDVSSMFENTDLVDICRRIDRVMDIPMIVDADDARGGSLSVLRLVRELEGAGVAAIELEDNAIPGGVGEHEHSSGGYMGDVPRHSLLLSKEEQVGKLRAAVDARRDPATVIIARTTAMEYLPKDEALDRIAAYATTGAEAIMLPNLPPDGPEGLIDVAEAANLPLCIRGLPAERIADEAFLEAARIRIRFTRQAPYAMAVKAIHDALTHLLAGEDPQRLADREASAELLSEVIRMPELIEWDRKYASS